MKEMATLVLNEDKEKIALIKKTVAKDATDDELQLFLYTAKKSGLDPLLRQIHCVKRKGHMAIQTGIDGYRLIADRTGAYAGNDDPVYDDEAKPRKASVTVYKLVNGQRCPFTATARWDQYFPGEAQGFMWTKMPHLMLGKCAEALALRKAFPAELSGLYTDDEMQQADTPKPTMKQSIAAWNERKSVGAVITEVTPEPLMAPEPVKVPPVKEAVDEVIDETPWEGDSTLSLEEMLTTIQAVSEKKDKKPFGAKTSKGEWFNTFDESVASFLRQAQKDKFPVKLVLEPRGKYKNIIDASQAPLERL